MAGQNYNKYLPVNSGVAAEYWQPLYDRMNYPTTGSAQIQMFSIPKGQQTTLIVNGASTANTAKTYLDTNIEAANFSPSKAYLIKGISIGFVHAVAAPATNPADRAKLVNEAWIKFRVVDTDILVLPMVAIPELNPMITSSQTANNTVAYGYAGGGGANLMMYKLGKPVTLQPNTNFTFEINVGRGTLVTVTQALDIIVMLQAYVLRPTG